MLKYYIQSFGCRATQADGAAIEAGLVRQGCQAAGGLDSADLVILNSCTVTSAADHDLRQAVRRARRSNPAARILVTGCYAQRAPEELAGLAGVTWVVGNSHKVRIPDLVLLAAATTATSSTTCTLVGYSTTTAVLLGYVTAAQKNLHRK